MKKLRVFLLGLAMICALCACGGGGGTSSPQDDLEQALKDKVWADVAVECKFSYADVKNVTTNVTDISEDDGTYTVKGKATVLDNYGDKYVGKFTAEYTYSESSESFNKVDLDLETPTKQK
ncbi:hypothetical protein D1159_03510 [Pseudoflavonifractor sp. 524-17]|uniref:hypothetical protein n=1 Tax=Pseudoflavonifractor sp. 524-17 TaxID=2304577 RepID=UPI00137AC907|nr:hypothetical protein [Pseudoflavonifractor sp. 524-17]NCE63670.1 hypothetical protein [Pseudoflavonifractor sp. 524-17]